MSESINSGNGASKGQQQWQAALEKGRTRDADFTTLSGMEVPMLASPQTLKDDGWAYEGDVGYPGVFPYTRGVYPTQYRGRLWTMRQFAGFGTAADTNARYHYLLKNGTNGLSVAFDMPTLMGYDSDHGSSAKGRWVAAVSPSRPWRTWSGCSRASPWGTCPPP